MKAAGPGIACRVIDSFVEAKQSRVYRIRRIFIQYDPFDDLGFPDRTPLLIVRHANDVGIIDTDKA